MSEQEIILGIILSVCVAWTVRRIALCFKRIKHGNNPCEGCPMGCNQRRGKCPDEKK